MEEGHVIDAGGQVREQVADPLAALAVLLELPLRPDDAALVLVPAAAERLDGNRLAVERVELRLVVEGIDVTRAAVAEDEDHALGLAVEVAPPRSQWVEELRLRRGAGAVEEAVGREQ